MMVCRKQLIKQILCFDYFDNILEEKNFKVFHQY